MSEWIAERRKMGRKVQEEGIRKIKGCLCTCSLCTESDHDLNEICLYFFCHCMAPLSSRVSQMKILILLNSSRIPLEKYSFGC